MTTYSKSEAIALSDNALDSAYALAYDTGDVNSASALEQEIVTRLENVSSFVGGFFGYKKFPLYDERGHFKQSAEAQTSVKENAKDVAVGIVDFTAGSVWKIALPLIIIGGLYIYITKVKK